MSANINWRPVSDEAPHLTQCWAPSSFMELMDRADLGIPRQVGPEDIGVLRGLSAGWNQENDPFAELIEVIEKHGAVYIWATY